MTLKNEMMNYSWYTVNVLPRKCYIYNYQTTTVKYIIHEMFILELAAYMRIDVFTTTSMYICVYERK